MATDEDYANERLEEMKDEKEKEVADLNSKLEAIAARQKELKAALYGRFGNSINLD